MTELAWWMWSGAAWFLLWFPLGWIGGLHLGAPLRRSQASYERQFVPAIAARVEPAPQPLQQVVIVPVGAATAPGTLPVWQQQPVPVIETGDR